MTKNKDCTRYYSNQQEEYISKLFGGNRVINSGASKFYKGDVILKKASLLIECKTCTTQKNTFSIKKEWIEKSKQEKNYQGIDNNCIAFQFGPKEQNYFIIDEKLMKYLVEKLENDNV